MTEPTSIWQILPVQCSHALMIAGLLAIGWFIWYWITTNDVRQHNRRVAEHRKTLPLNGYASPAQRALIDEEPALESDRESADGQTVLMANLTTRKVNKRK